MKKRYITPEVFSVIIDDAVILSGSATIGVTTTPGDNTQEVLAHPGSFEDFDDDDEE